MSDTQDKWADGNAYEAYVGRWSRLIGDKFLTSLEPEENRHWLDLGCGTGALTSQILARWSPQSIIGVEPSEDFLAIANNQFEDSLIEFRRGNGDQIPVSDKTIDYAVSGFVLNFVDDKSNTLKELIRTVKPGGTIAAYVWDYAGHVQFMRYFWDAAISVNPTDREKDEGVRFPICRPEPLRSLFEAAGLRQVTVNAIDVPTPFDDFTEYWTPFLSGIAPAPGYCVSLDDSSREKVRSLLQRTLPTDPDGKILLAARAWAVRGTV